MRPEHEPLNSDASPADAPEGRAGAPAGAAADEAGGGLLTSRPPCNPISYGGEDWLTLSLYVLHWDFERTAKSLDEKRSAAEARRQGDDELLLAGQTFLVRPSGAKVGSKRGKAYFRWQLQSETGFVLQLMNLPAFKGTMPNAKLVATSSVMMSLGIQGVVQHALAAIEALGATVVQIKVSRVDVCCDLPGRKVEPLEAAYEDRRGVTQRSSNGMRRPTVHPVFAKWRQRSDIAAIAYRRLQFTLIRP